MNFYFQTSSSFFLSCGWYYLCHNLFLTTLWIRWSINLQRVYFEENSVEVSLQFSELFTSSQAWRKKPGSQSISYNFCRSNNCWRRSLCSKELYLDLYWDRRGCGAAVLFRSWDTEKLLARAWLSSSIFPIKENIRWFIHFILLPVYRQL